MFLNISKHVLHVIMVWRVLEVSMSLASWILMRVMVGAASVSVACGWELHVDNRRIVGKVFCLSVILWGPVWCVTHQVSIREAVVVHIAISKFLLVSINFVQFWAHLCVSIPSSHLTSKNVSALRCCSWLPISINRIWAYQLSLVYLGCHILIVGDKLLVVTPIDRSDSTVSRMCPSACSALMTISGDNFALRCNCWDLVVIFLNWRQID